MRLQRLLFGLVQLFDVILRGPDATKVSTTDGVRGLAGAGLSWKVKWSQDGPGSSDQVACADSTDRMHGGSVGPVNGSCEFAIVAATTLLGQKTGGHATDVRICGQRGARELMRCEIAARKQM